MVRDRNVFLVTHKTDRRGLHVDWPDRERSFWTVTHGGVTEAPDLPLPHL